MNSWFKPREREVEPLILNMSHRRQMIDKAMIGATVTEQIWLVHHAFSKLSTTEQNAIVREIDRANWKAMKP